MKGMRFQSKSSLLKDLNDAITSSPLSILWWMHSETGDRLEESVFFYELTKGFNPTNSFTQGFLRYIDAWLKVI